LALDLHPLNSIPTVIKIKNEIRLLFIISMGLLHK